MNKHTTGQWEVVSGQNNFMIQSLARRGDLDRYIARTINDTIEDKANARLIVSAPELLEACKYAYKAVNANLDIEGLKFASEKCKQAIAKAEGELK